MSPLSLGGLASGIDTDTIITQLMAIERQPRNRLELADTRAAARQTGLKDLATKLGAVRDAANALKTTTTWANIQKLTSSDPAKVAVRAEAGAAPGTHEIRVTSLAVAAQHAFDYTAGGSLSTIHIGAYELDVAASSTVATVAAQINDDADAPVSAVVAGGKLVLTSRTTGTDGAFTATISGPALLGEDIAFKRDAANANYSVDGVAQPASQSNVVTDGMLGFELTLKGLTTDPVSGITTPVSVTAGDPTPDTDAIKAKVTAFVNAYNSAGDFIRGKLAEVKVKSPTTNTEAARGLFAGDSMLTGALAAMRTQVGDLSAYGISTGASTGSGSVSADAVAGKLTVNDTKLTAALTSNRDALHTALSAAGTRMSEAITPVAGARVTAALDGVSAERTRLTDAMSKTDVRLATREKRLRAQFTAMEAALAASQAAQAQLTAQLSSLG